MDVRACYLQIKNTMQRPAGFIGIVGCPFIIVKLHYCEKHVRW